VENPVVETPSKPGDFGLFRPASELWRNTLVFVHPCESLTGCSRKRKTSSERHFGPGSRAWRAISPVPRRDPFIWAHPPYWRQKLYACDPRDLSRAPTLELFLERYGMFLQNSANALAQGGKLAILMGDYSDREAGFVPLVYHTKRLAFLAGLRQHCTDIIRFSHGATSSKRVYRSSFIPGLHDVCMVFERP